MSGTSVMWHNAKALKASAHSSPVCKYLTIEAVDGKGERIEITFFGLPAAKAEIIAKAINDAEAFSEIEPVNG